MVMSKLTTNFAKIFVLNEGRRTKMGYSLMSCCFVWVWVRIKVSIYKQRHMIL
jgi:hypothetical protein